MLLPGSRCPPQRSSGADHLIPGDRARPEESALHVAPGESPVVTLCFERREAELVERVADGDGRARDLETGERRRDGRIEIGSAVSDDELRRPGSIEPEKLEEMNVTRENGLDARGKLVSGSGLQRRIVAEE